MSKHYQRFILSLNYKPLTTEDTILLDRVYNTARQAERLGRSALALALVDVSATLEGALRQAVLNAACRVAA